MREHVILNRLLLLPCESSVRPHPKFRTHLCHALQHNNSNSLDPTCTHAYNTEMGNLISKVIRIAGAILSGLPLEAVQDNNVPRNNIGVSMGEGGKFTAQTVNNIFNNNSSSSTTSQTTRRNPFRFNIPVPNKHFKGREDTLDAVSDFFSKLPADTSDTCDRTIVIAGSGGMGKTETAYKVAAKLENLLPSVAWIDAETQESLLQSFLGLAKKLEGTEKELTNGREKADMSLVKAVYEHIDQNDYGNVLFIFDNAIRFKSSGGEFAIFDFMPTDSLTNKRYPYILITTQTHEWGKQTKVLQVDALSEEKSLEFFHSSFRVNSKKCDEEFKRLHKVTEGYPLVMNLAASNIDYNRRPNDVSLQELQQKINDYITELAKESGKILNEEMKHWPTSYKKTLSAAWKLTIERLEQEPNGREALKILQICSFLELPIDSDDVRDILTLLAAGPHPANMELQLRDPLHLLERFYAARILKVHRDNADGFSCVLGIHRLVQLAVRRETNCSQVLLGIIDWKVLMNSSTRFSKINTSALHDAMRRTDLPQMALDPVGVLACLGDPIASDIVQTRKPETKAAEAVWRLYKMKTEIRNSHSSAVQLLTELIELWKSTEVPRDRRMYFLIAFNILVDEVVMFTHGSEDERIVFRTPNFRSLWGIENLACELILEFVSFGECRCKSCMWINRVNRYFNEVPGLLIELIKEFVHPDVQWSESMRAHLTHAFLNIIPLLKQKELGWRGFWCIMSEAVGVSQSRMAELRTIMWDHGLAQKLEQIFQCHQHSNYTYHDNFALARCMDFFLDGMPSTDQRVQQVMLAFTQMTARILAQIEDVKKDSKRVILRGQVNYFMCDVCLVWILLLIMSERSEGLLELLSRCEALAWLEGDRAVSSRFDLVHEDSLGYAEDFRDDFKPRFPQFILKYSSSEVKRIQTLVKFCRIFLSLVEKDTSSES